MELAITLLVLALLAVLFFWSEANTDYQVERVKHRSNVDRLTDALDNLVAVQKAYFEVRAKQREAAAEPVLDPYKRYPGGKALHEQGLMALEAIDQIVINLTGREWSPEDLEMVASVINATGMWDIQPQTEHDPDDPAWRGDPDYYKRMD